jgi:sn-1 stearoyl-lipid 9-desaturase
MSKLTALLDPPSYGFLRGGRFYRPTHREILSEFFRRLNIINTRKNWLPLFGWISSFSLGIPLGLFLIFHFSWTLLGIGFVYSMVILGTHGTFWLHRYSTHRAFQFSNSFFRILCRNLVIKIVPEEIYVVSHHVHHRIPEQSGDPYNVHGGWLYCFLADVNHQTISKTLSRSEYQAARKILRHTGVILNSYEGYRRWGSICHPAYTILHYFLNWSFWYLAFFFIGGHPLALAIFGMSGVWAMGIRTFNYNGHGRGKDKKREGVDFHLQDLSVNQIWPGMVAGEWHNNHHMYPNSARSGFLKYQMDLPWGLIRFLYCIGAVSSYRDDKAEFLRKYFWAG